MFGNKHVLPMPVFTGDILSLAGSIMWYSKITKLVYSIRKYNYKK